MTFYPLNFSTWNEKENVALRKVIKSNYFTMGSKVEEFEKKFAKWNGSKYSVFVNSGSSANLLIIQCAKELYRWKNGDC